MFKSITSILIFSFLFLSASGQDKIQVELSHDSILVGNAFKLSYHLNTLEGELIPPSFDSCKVSGPSISSHYQSINGEVSQKKSYTYIIQPLKEGVLILDGAYLKSNMTEVKSQQLRITVLPNPDNIIDDTFNSNPFSFDFDSKLFESPIEQAKPEKKRKRRKF